MWQLIYIAKNNLCHEHSCEWCNTNVMIDQLHIWARILERVAKLCEFATCSRIRARVVKCTEDFLKGVGWPFKTGVSVIKV